MAATSRHGRLRSPIAVVQLGVANGLALLASRVPVGWLSDRYRSPRLIVSGLATTAVVIVALTLQPVTPALIVIAVVSASAGALVFTPTLVELARRSTPAERGSAFSLFSASLAAGVALGSVGGAPLVSALGFEGAMLASLVGLVLAAWFALADPGMRRA